MRLIILPSFITSCFYIGLLLQASCSNPSRFLANDTTQPIEQTETSITEGSLQVQKCPPKTELISIETQVSVDQCLRDYVHNKTTHGVTRKYTCFHTGTAHERSLRVPRQGQIYTSLLNTISFPNAEGTARVDLISNHAFYRLQWVSHKKDNSPSPKEVHKAFRSIKLPEKVLLERCVCNTKKYGEETCLNFLSDTQ